jgi:hypothetical protein
VQWSYCFFICQCSCGLGGRDDPSESELCDGLNSQHQEPEALLRGSLVLTRAFISVEIGWGFVYTAFAFLLGPGRDCSNLADDLNGQR